MHAVSPSLRRQFLLLAAPLVLIGTLLILTAGVGLDIPYLVAAMLVVTGCLRLFARARATMQRVIGRHLAAFLVGLGAIHGLSNLGGGVLHGDRRIGLRHPGGYPAADRLLLRDDGGDSARHSPAHDLDVNGWLCLMLPVLAAGTYLTVGSRTFRATGQTVYQHALTMLIVAFGVELIVSR